MTRRAGLGRPGAGLGPVIDDDRVRAVESMVSHALDRGARRLTREHSLPQQGSWVAPTLLADVPAQSPLSCQEVFGPVAAVTRVADEDAALRACQRHRDGAVGLRLVARRRAGMAVRRATRGGDHRRQRRPAVGGVRADGWREAVRPRAARAPTSGWRSSPTCATSPSASDVDAVQLALLAGAVLVGSATQRLTGVGFALVSSPFLVLLLGPFQGVLLANVLSLATNLIVMSLTWRGIELRRLLLLVVPAVVRRTRRGLGDAAAADRRAAGRGGFAGGGVAGHDGARAPGASAAGTLGCGRGGALSGFMNVTAGIGGPGVTLYAVSAAWEHTAFVATMQPYFALVNSASIIAKGLPSLPGVALVVALAALGVGAVVGQRAQRAGAGRRCPARDHSARAGGSGGDRGEGGPAPGPLRAAVRRPSATTSPAAAPRPPAGRQEPAGPGGSPGRSGCPVPQRLAAPARSRCPRRPRWRRPPARTSRTHRRARAWPGRRSRPSTSVRSSLM